MTFIWNFKRSHFEYRGINGNDRKGTVKTGLDFPVNLWRVLLLLPGGSEMDTLVHFTK
jgi:hypothetical protein